MKLLLLIGALLALLGMAYVLPLDVWFLQGLTWIEAHPSVAWLVFIVAYVAAAVLMLPGSLLTLAGGFLFGLGYGFVLVSAASVCGACLAFIIGRFVARDWVAERLRSMPRFRALDAAVAERGALIVFLTRLSPLFPYNLLNYAFGLTAVRFWTYAGLSWVGMMPATLLYVYLGSIASDLASVLAGDLAASPLGRWPLYLGLLATAVLTVLVSRIATRELADKLDNVEVQ